MKGHCRRLLLEEQYSKKLTGREEKLRKSYNVAREREKEGKRSERKRQIAREED
jgi:hypothetical protein